MFARLGPRSPTVSDHERVWGRRVSRGPGPWSPVISDHERHGLRGFHALPMVFDHERNGAGRVSRGSGPGWRERNLGGCHAVRVHGLPWSDHGAGGHHAARLRDLHGLRSRATAGVALGSAWSPIMSAVGLGGCHAVRVRGFPWTPIMSNKLGRVSRAGFAVSWLLRGVERVSRAWVRGLPASPIMSAMGPPW